MWRRDHNKQHDQDQQSKDGMNNDNNSNDDDNDNERQQRQRNDVNDTTNNNTDASSNRTSSNQRLNNNDRNSSSDLTSRHDNKNHNKKRNNIRPCNDTIDLAAKLRPASSNETVETASSSYLDNTSYSTSLTATTTSSPIRDTSHRLLASSDNTRRNRERIIRPSANLFNRQLNILLSSTGISLFLFLFFFLNIFAFTALLSLSISIVMLVYTSYTYISYLISTDQLNILTILPESIRNRILHNSIHEIFTSDSGFVDNHRFLLLYLIPGLSPSQILEMVNRLPARHRDLVLGPGGLARIIMPNSTTNNVMMSHSSGSSSSLGSSVEAGSSNGGSGRSTSQIVPVVPSTPSMSSPTIRMTNNNNHTPISPLTPLSSFMQSPPPVTPQVTLPVIEEEDNEEVTGVDEITNSDAMRAIFNTARSLFMTGINQSRIDDDPIAEELYDNTMQQDSHQDSNVRINDLNWENMDNNDIDEVEIQSHGSASSDASSDLGLDVSPDALSGNLQQNQLSRIARLVGLGNQGRVRQDDVPAHEQPPQERRSQPPATVTAHSLTQDTTTSTLMNPLLSQDRTEESRLTEEEHNLEGEIINEAFSTVMSTYFDIATSSMTNMVVDLVESVAPSVIRAGVRLSSISGLGLLGMLSSQALHYQPLNIMGRSITSRNLSDNRTGRFVVRSLVSTLGFGMVTIGSAYLTRTAARRYRCSLRQGSDSNNKHDSKDKNLS